MPILPSPRQLDRAPIGLGSISPIRSQLVPFGPSERSSGPDKPSMRDLLSGSPFFLVRVLPTVKCLRRVLPEESGIEGTPIACFEPEVPDGFGFLFDLPSTRRRTRGHSATQLIKSKRGKPINDRVACTERGCYGAPPFSGKTMGPDCRHGLYGRHD